MTDRINPFAPLWGRLVRRRRAVAAPWLLEEGNGPDSDDRPAQSPPAAPPRAHGANQGPPDLDELWRDFNRRLGGIFGGGGSGGGGGGRRRGGGPRHTFHPNPKGTRIGVGVVVVGLVVLWLASGFFMVHEGDQAVVTTFGKFDGTRTAGLNWRLPYPIQDDEIVHFSQIRSVDVGGDSVIKSTGLRESGMLTKDENIIEAKFAVQYRLDNSRDYLFNTKDPNEAVVQVAESAVREVVGKMTMDTALAEGRDQIAPRVRDQMQSILDHYGVGISIVAVNMQQGGTRPPEQVQDAFDDVIKASQEAERTRNEAQAYANDIVPRAKGSAARLTEEAQGYKARVEARAKGDAQRFLQVLPEYQKAPKVTRDRMYIDTMAQVYSGVNKVIIDSKSGGNLLYLPIDKLVKESAANAKDRDAQGTPLVSHPANATAPKPEAAAGGSSSSRARDTGRTRTSDFR